MCTKRCHMKKQQNNLPLKITRRDIIISSVLLIAAVAACFLMRERQNGITARVYLDGQTVFESNLSDIKEKKVITPVVGVEITAENGKIGFTSSSCQSHDCIKSGMLSKPYSTAACIPNRVLITLSPNGHTGNGYDSIAY